MSAPCVRILQWQASSEEAGETIQEFLRQKGCSHHVLTRLKKTPEGILQNGVWTYANQKVSEGDLICIRLTETPEEKILPVPLPISVVYEDEDLMVIDKPSNMPVHPSAGNHGNTLANAVLFYAAQEGRPLVFRCINRLDRDTSGLLIVARNSFSAAVLYEASANRQLSREYLAIAEGIFPGAGVISAPIARKEGSPLMRCVDYAHGESAVTEYRCAAILKRKQGNGENNSLPEFASLLRLRLRTGRTHQIRVHLADAGHPLLGDFLYHPDSVCTLAPRQMLHSACLRFTHPVSGRTLTFESALPADMQALLEHYEPRDGMPPHSPRLTRKQSGI